MFAAVGEFVRAVCATKQGVCILRPPPEASEAEGREVRLRLHFPIHWPFLELTIFVFRRVDALESKVDGLLARLAVFTDQPTGPVVTATSAGIPTPFTDDTPCSAPQPADSPQTETTDDALLAAPDTGAADIVDRGLISVEEARALISDFREHHVRHFPFTPLAPEETADYLRIHSPFLFLSIAAAVCHGRLSLQMLLAGEVTKQISSRLILGVERSLDLWRGLLVHAAWYHHLSKQGHSQIFLMTQLCMTVAHDLEADRRQEVKNMEKRAFLGTYWLSIWQVSHAPRFIRASLVNADANIPLQCCESRP
jgi:hypothetical protein